MFKILPNNKILLTKGDDAELEVVVKDKDGNVVEITETDSLVMTVRKNGSAEVALTKTAEEDTFYISHSDTASLSSGLYIYDIQLVNENNEISTIIPTSFFELRGEITV